jgi:hypothetical protein
LGLLQRELKAAVLVERLQQMVPMVAMMVESQELATAAAAVAKWKTAAASVAVVMAPASHRGVLWLQLMLYGQLKKDMSRAAVM